MAIQFVPDELKTDGVCWAAVEQDAHAIRYVPDEKRTLEMCWSAVKRKGSTLQYVPEAFKTHEMCMEAVKKFGESLYDVPDDMRTLDVCVAAVRDYGPAIADVPTHLMKAVNEFIAAHPMAEWKWIRFSGNKSKRILTEYNTILRLNEFYWLWNDGHGSGVCLTFVR